MLGWKEFASEQPEMAAFGEERLKFNVMYLGTVGPDGYPRVHPFTPFIGSGRLFAFMHPTSPKGKDLQRNGRYSMHSPVGDQNGKNGEFQIGGDAFLLQDSESRKRAVEAYPYTPQGQYVLYEFKIDRCMTNLYKEDGSPNVKRWRAKR